MTMLENILLILANQFEPHIYFNDLNKIIFRSVSS